MVVRGQPTLAQAILLGNIRPAEVQCESEIWLSRKYPLKTSLLKAKQSGAARVAEPAVDTRAAILTLAQELLVKYGVRGCTFQDIAEQLNITRANVHYHFGNKSDLIDEVVVGYIGLMTQRFHDVWVDERLSLSDKVRGTIAINRSRYDHFNRTLTGQGWSLITRMRGEEEALSDRSATAVRQFSKDVADAVETGINHAVKTGELSRDTPVTEVTVQLVNIISCAGLTTLDAGAFDQLEMVYLGFLHMLLAAYGNAQQQPTGERLVSPKPRPKIKPSGGSAHSKC